MKFRKQVSFNRHDCELSKGGKRITVKLGTKKRCDLTLMGVLRFGAKGVGLSDLTEHLNERFGNSYSESDISSACKRLIGGGFIVPSGRGRATVYRGAKNALANWRKTEKAVL